MMARRPAAQKPRISTETINLEGARKDFEMALASGPRTLVLCFEDETGKPHCLARPHTRGVIGGLLLRVLMNLKLPR